MGWSVLAQRQMCASLVVIAHIRSQNLPQVGLAGHDHMVEAFPSDRTDEPLDISILPGRPRCCGSIPDAHCSQTPDDCIGVNRVSISDHVFWDPVPRKCIDDLSCYPF